MALKPVPKGEEITDNICKHMDRRFLSSLDLIGAGEVALTIDRVEHHNQIKYANGSNDSNVNLLYFSETEKPLALNTTNIKAIVAIIGSNKVSEWKGNKVKLTVKKVEAFGKMQDAVRIIGKG
jgi:hypothetical protein